MFYVCIYFITAWVCLSNFNFFQEQKAIGGGGDLMADLHAKLSLRRKVWTILFCVD